MDDFTIEFLMAIVDAMPKPKASPRKRRCPGCQTLKPRQAFALKSSITCELCELRIIGGRLKNRDAVRRWRARNPDAEKSYRHAKAERK